MEVDLAQRDQPAELCQVMNRTSRPEAWGHKSSDS